MSEIKYSDLIEDDGAIQKAINDLTALKQAFTEVGNLVKSEALTIKTSLQSTSTSTDSGRQSMERMVNESSRLKRAQDELEFALSETGAKVAELRMLTNEANTASKNNLKTVREESDSYNKLKMELDAAIAVYKGLTAAQREDTSVGEVAIKTIRKLREELKVIDARLKANTASVKRRVAEINNLRKAEDRLAYALSEENQKVLALNASTREANRVAKLNAIVANNAEGSYNRLSAQYELNKIALNKMSLAERENTAQGKALVEKTRLMYEEMIRLQEVTGKHTLSVGNYKKAWDGVRMGVDQIVREMPTLGISMNTFFLAISNNLPILVDEINKVREANKMAAKENRAQQSILRSVTSAIFSFNSVLIIAATVLSKYGTVIFDWIGSMFKAKSAIDDLTTSQKALVYIMSEDAGSAKQRIETVIELGVQIRKYGNDSKYTKAIIEEFNKTFDTHYKSMLEIKKEYPILADQVINAAIKMAAAQKLISDAATQMLRKQKAEMFLAGLSESEFTEASVNMNKLFRLLDTSLREQGVYAEDVIKIKNKLFAEVGQGNFISSGLVPTLFATEFTKQMRAAKDSSPELYKVMQQFGTTAGQKMLTALVNSQGSSVAIADMTKAIQELYQANLSELVSTTTTKSPKDRTEQIQKANNDIRKRYEESLTALILNEFDNRERDLKDTFEAEKRELLNKQKNDKDLTKESRGLITETIINMEKKLTEDLSDLEYDRQIAILEIQEEGLALQEEALRENTYEAMELRLSILEVQRQKELVANRKLIEQERQDENAINAKWNNIINEASKKETLAIEMENFEIQSQFRESEFNLVERTEREKTKFKLLEERKRWTLLLRLATAGSIQATEIELEAFKNMIKAIDRELKMSTLKDFNIYEALGLNDEQQKAAEQAVKLTVSYLQEILQAEKELADQAVELAQKRVDAAKTALEQEIEARNNGYAFNVSQAQKELAQARAQEKEKLKLQEEAAKRQEALNTISQTSSLITAAANIWATFSKIPGFGVPLALGAIATMFGSFAIAKVRASQVTRNKSDVESYGEGGLEMLEGGSHASGNDIAIGKTSKGKDRRAEGGEALAIINKRNTRKYRTLLPDLITSLNKGTFEKRYLNSFADSANFNVAISQDFSGIESDVRSIKEQNEMRYYVDSKGRLIRKYKNLTSIYK